MPYVPEPTHPVKVDENGESIPLSAQLNREFRAVQLGDLLLTNTVEGAVPWKAFMMILDGVGGAVGGGPNVTVPTIFDEYNIDEDVGIIRTSEGVYVFTLLISLLREVPILTVLYPDFNLLVSPFPANLDPTAESVRVAITDTDLVTGTFEVTIEQLEVPASGKGTWTPYDMRATDRLWSTGMLNFAGRAIDRNT